MYPTVSHGALAGVPQMCVRYISVFLKQEKSRGNVAPLQSFPTLSYILSSGINHLTHVDLVKVLEALRSLGSEFCHHPSHRERPRKSREEVL